VYQKGGNRLFALAPVYGVPVHIVPAHLPAAVVAPHLASTRSFIGCREPVHLSVRVCELV